MKLTNKGLSSYGIKMRLSYLYNQLEAGALKVGATTMCGNTLSNAINIIESEEFNLLPKML